MKCYFQKTCRVCSNLFYFKEVSEEHLADAQFNPNLEIEYRKENGVTLGVMTLMSICPVCIMNSVC
jgi:hypothetical protein